MRADWLSTVESLGLDSLAVESVSGDETWLWELADVDEPEFERPVFVRAMLERVIVGNSTFLHGLREACITNTEGKGGHSYRLVSGSRYQGIGLQVIARERGKVGGWRTKRGPTGGSIKRNLGIVQKVAGEGR